MMTFLTLRIWQAYAFEHPQFWQRIDAPVHDVWELERFQTALWLFAFTTACTVRYVDPRYCRAEMYAGRVACCFPVIYDKYMPTGHTDRRTDATPLLYAFR